MEKDTESSFKTIQTLMDAHNKKVFAETADILNLFIEYAKRNEHSFKEFIDEICLNYSKEKQSIYKEHDIDNTLRFNFFESISDKWYRENFHSDVLYTILNPNTPEIGRKYFLQEFVAFLGIEDKFDCHRGFEVIKEALTGIISWKDDDGNFREREGFIDLLIKNETQAIIIENKINYAPDMENQLVRYMKYVDEVLGIKSYTVVYLTLTDDNNKKPPLDSYDKDFAKYSKKLKDKNSGILKEVYAVDDTKSVAKDFLPACCKRLQEEAKANKDKTNACNIASVYIDQYRILLEHEGGRAYMRSTDKELAKKIYSSEENWNAANDFVEFWNNRWGAVKEAMEDKFKERFPDKDLRVQTLQGCKLYLWQHATNDYFIYWDANVDVREIGLGSLEGKEFDEKEQEKLFSKVCKLHNRESEFKSEGFVFCYIKDSPTLIDDVLNGLEELFKS